MQHSTSIDPATAVSTQGRPQTRISPSETAGQNSQPLISIYGILDTFLDLGIQDIRTLPVFQFAQIAHASVSLQKMYNYAKYDPSYSKQLPVSARMVEQYLSRLIEALRAGAEQGKSLPAHSFLMVITAVRALFNQYKDMDLDEIRAVYHGMFPGTSQIQILDLQEPTPTPQNPPRRSKSSTDGALHLLSEAAMGKSKGSSYKADEAQTSGPQAVPEGGNMRAMGKLLVPSGGGKLGVIGDDGFFDIIHEMATKAS